jgi:4-hydroxy-tetrahydrodipicolinate synthase
MLYNIPIFASPIDVPTVQRLAELPRIIGIKDSSGDIAHMLRMMDAVHSVRPDFAFLTGWDAALVPMLAMGCQGATLAMSGVVPEVTGNIYKLTIDGQLDEARALQLRLSQLFDFIMQSATFPEGVRAAVEARGFRLGASRQPVDPSQQIDRKRLEQFITGLLAAC